MASNVEIEQRWIDAWSDLAEIVRDRRDVPCLLPDGSIVMVEDCQVWLQASAYLGYQVRVAAGWVGHRRGVIAERWHAVATGSIECQIGSVGQFDSSPRSAPADSTVRNGRWRSK